MEARLKTQAGFDAYFKLAEERRQEFKAKMPIAEFPLLLPQTNIRAEREKNATRRHRGGGLTMPKLASFSTPARLPDPNAGAWSRRVARMLAPYLDGSLPQFYDPTRKNTPAGHPGADGLVGRVPRGPARDDPVAAGALEAARTATATCRTSTASGASRATTPARSRA